MAKKLPSDDQSRFNKVMEIFPEQFIDNFINYFLWNGHYEVKVDALLDKYDLYSREVLSEFMDKNINIAWQEFNKSFYALRSFLATEFDIPQAHFKMYDKPPFVYLKPAWHHNFNEALLDREKREPLWNSLKKQLDEVSSEFEKKYRNFVKVASATFSNSQEQTLAKNQGYSIKTNSKDKEKLKFYSDTGDISYKNEDGEVRNGHKGFSLLSLLNDNKNTPFSIDDIKKHCNPLVNKKAHCFKKEKDTDDTIRLIKSKLKVGKNAYFPIVKKGSKNNKEWLWIEK